MMRWPWQREEPGPADKALAEAREQRKEAERRRPEIQSLAARLRELREENHLAERVRRALGEGS